MLRLNNNIFKIMPWIKKKLSSSQIKWGIRVILLVIFPFFLWMRQFLISSYPVLVRIPPGTNSEQIIQLIYEKDLIHSPVIFKLWMKIKGAEGEIKAGDYLLNRRMNMFTILDKLVGGETVFRSLTIPEGYSARQIASLITREGYGNGEIFLKLVYDTPLCEKLGIPASSLDGYLFPDTYYLPLDMDEESIIKLMVVRFQEVIQPYQARIREIGLSLHQIVTLASIIEKEAMLPKEKPIISAVFHNRLRQNMALQSCATVIYALGGTKVELNEKDLLVQSPYNTYIHRGLPPGPISNPGFQALEAALYPATVNYLYFVSRNDGSHAFSADYQEFLRSKWKYQKNNK